MKQLEEYYKAYVEKVRGLSKSTAVHYAQAVHTASRYLRDAGLINDDLYEIESLSELRHLRDVLYAMPDFVEQNTTGNHMYSNGVNKYILFAEYGQDKEAAAALLPQDEQLALLDRPMTPPTEKECVRLHCWNRDRIIVGQVLKACQRTCEINESHKTFISRSSNAEYIEGHHLIPLSRQKFFPSSLDVYANIIGLCPNCHRMLHHGRHSEVRELLSPIYDVRAPRFAASGINLSKEEFLNIAAG